MPFCPKCAREVSSEAQFCSRCGAKLEEVCPQCGFKFAPGERFCGKCGYELTKEVTEQAAGPKAEVKHGFYLSNTIAAGVGAVMMLVSLAVPWYTMKGGWLAERYRDDVTPSDLLWRDLWPGVARVGPSVTLILTIIFAVIVLLSVAYCLRMRGRTRALWALMGSLSAICVIVNWVYILRWEATFKLYLYAEQTQIQAGSIVAFVGAMVVVFSSIGRKHTTYSILWSIWASIWRPCKRIFSKILARD